MRINRRTMLGASAALLAHSALPTLARAQGGVDPLTHVDPELRPAARELLAKIGQFPPITESGLPAVRAGIIGFAPPRLDSVPVVERRISGAAGAPDVQVYIINAQPGAVRPGILHTHGGGFIMGSVLSDIRTLQEFALTLDAVVVSVEYRLAPETRYHGSIEDNYAALKWMYGHPGELGLDPNRIALTGESAGGGHAALLAITARDRGEVPVLFQSLVYPMLDDRTGSSRAVAPHVGSIVWTPELNRLGWRSFLGEQPGTSAVPTSAVPARTESLAGLPPAWIGVGSIDLFVEEDIEYARRLINAGVPAELFVVPGAFHGFDGIAAATGPARRFKEARTAALRRAFELADMARAPRAAPAPHS